MKAILRMVITFAFGFVLSIGVGWVRATMFSHTPYQFNWIGAVGTGVILAVLELIFPTILRNKDNKDQKDK